MGVIITSENRSKGLIAFIDPDQVEELPGAATIVPSGYIAPK
jgi:hypothetical protein